MADAWQDRGVGSEAMRALIRYLVEERGHHRLTVDPAAANARAIHVYERLGFRRVGTMHAYERTTDGTWRDALLMELIVGAALSGAAAPSAEARRLAVARARRAIAAGAALVRCRWPRSAGSP